MITGFENCSNAELADYIEDECYGNKNGKYAALRFQYVCGQDVCKMMKMEIVKRLKTIGKEFEKND